MVSAERVASVGALLARFHRAAATFMFKPADEWRGGRTVGVSHSIVCHNDPGVGNVVFDGACAKALIDFDFAGPNDPLRDLAIAAQHWVPLGDRNDMLAPLDAPQPERLRLICDAYGVASRQLSRLLDLVEMYLEHGRRGVLARVAAGEARFVAYWDAGLGDRLARALAWLRAERATLLATTFAD